ncbi:tetratricopeptide repeat protein [Methylobacterium radiodurans]|uniref:protein O-GlcNAc transferase n=1 Tax=Methylobacterium radiodurans TaxID=2202828 RepID=A0A2U8VV23_9HYPH|nr:tetratricopeptide repeat protein [Methylobacterium radiodurans]AWN37644.1 hypothetical protein DK427_19515 [Methylobacterium radiodurans]
MGRRNRARVVLQQAGPRTGGGSARRLPVLEAMGRALRLHGEGRLAPAEAAYREVLRQDPGNAAARHALGLCLRLAGRLPEALAAFQQAATLAPNDPNIQADLGSALVASRDEASARDAFRAALARDAGHRAAWDGLIGLGEGEAAVAPLRRLLAAQPAAPESYLLLGRVLSALGRTEEARGVFRSGIEAGILSEPALSTYAMATLEAGRTEEGLAVLRLLTELHPDDAGLHNLLACALLSHFRLPEAYTALRHALAADPRHVRAHINLGMVYTQTRRTNEAVACFRTALSLDPDSVLACFELLDQRRHACDWDGLIAEDRALVERILETGTRLSPFKLLVMQAGPDEILRATRIWAAEIRPASTDLLPPPPPPVPGRRIRIGYLSYDFFDHATTQLAVALFERHDRARFEVFAYSFSPDDGSAMRRRVVAAFDHFVEVGALSDADAARRIRADGIDVLVDLKGYTYGARTRILALRPAPVQVNYLGYPGSMGAPFIDYILGDPLITPLDHQPFYDERIVQLPDCYQPNDGDRVIADAAPSRADCGLPDGAFVFCCFNNTYKITPSIFAAWMRILARVPGAVLWLYEANPAAQDNLQYAAGAHGIDPERIVFAGHVGSPEHRARLRHADLVLDTLPYNAHTTASDALWAGVPVLTCLGETMAGRVAGSLLRAAGLPELVTTTQEAYEALACALAADRPRLDGLRARLAANRARAPLFDPARYARGIEAAFARMHDLRCAGRPPEPFAVPPEPVPDGFDPGSDGWRDPRADARPAPGRP